MLAAKTFRLRVSGPVTTRTVRVLAAAPTPQAAHRAKREVLVQELNKLLTGGEVEGRTRRALVRPLKVINCSQARMRQGGRSRQVVSALDLDILWEGERLATASLSSIDTAGASMGHPVPSSTVQGVARIKLFKSPDNTDRVLVTDVQVLSGAGEGTAQPSPAVQLPSADVLLAVQAMDSSIMRALNDYMWELEESHSFALASFEWDEDEKESEGAVPTVRATAD